SCMEFSSNPDQSHLPVTRSEIWNYFGFLPDETGKPIDDGKPICRECLQRIQAKGGNTSNLIKHLWTHPTSFAEYTKVSGTYLPVYLPSTSKEAAVLNRAVAELICLDQIPVYTVDRFGFKQLVKKLNSKYELPSRNFFMNNEIPKMHTETGETIKAELEGSGFYSCSTDLWTCRTMQSYMAVTAQDRFTQSPAGQLDWQIQSWCLGCAELNSDHTTESLSEAISEMLEEQWGFNLRDMAGITDNASNIIKAFSDCNWIPCFGYNLDLSRLRRTVSAFSRSAKLTVKVKAAYDMVERFLEQQQAVCAVLADNRNKWHLMPKDLDVTTMDALKHLLGPRREFTDALSGEQHPTVSSVLPLLWKTESILIVSASDSQLSSRIKDCISFDLQNRYNQKELLYIFRPEIQRSFVSNVQEVEARFQQQVEKSLMHAVPSAKIANQPNSGCPKSGLSGLLAGIMNEKRGATPHTTEDDVMVSAAEHQVRLQDDPLKWWRQNEGSFPVLLMLAKRYLCISAMSCASERIFSLSGNICTPLRSRLTSHHLDMLVFLGKNLHQYRNICLWYRDNPSTKLVLNFRNCSDISFLVTVYGCFEMPQCIFVCTHFKCIST
uniref:BED-type domain-containing protein n=1 Tax=Cyprinus carpio TaxID=7962 RepID=A0A8C1X632_CYPCA